MVFGGCCLRFFQAHNCDLLDLLATVVCRLQHKPGDDSLRNTARRAWPCDLTSRVVGRGRDRLLLQCHFAVCTYAFRNPANAAYTGMPMARLNGKVKPKAAVMQRPTLASGNDARIEAGAAI